METKVGGQGDLAIVQFINMDWIAKFRGSGGSSWLRGAGWRWRSLRKDFSVLFDIL